MTKYLIAFIVPLFCFISCKKESTVADIPVDTTDYSANRIPLKNWGNDTITYTHIDGSPYDTIYTFQGDNNTSMFSHGTATFCIWIDTTTDYYNKTATTTNESYLVGISKTISSKKLSEGMINYSPIDTITKDHWGQTLVYIDGGYLIIDNVSDMITLFNISESNSIFGYSCIWTSVKTDRTISLK